MKRPSLVVKRQKECRYCSTQKPAIMKAETEAKHICRNGKDIGQSPAGLKPQFVCGSNLSEEETVRLDTTVNDLDVERCSGASSNAHHGVSTASHGPPALHTVSFGSRLYREEGIFAAAPYRRAAQKRTS